MRTYCKREPKTARCDVVACIRSVVNNLMTFDIALQPVCLGAFGFPPNYIFTEEKYEVAFTEVSSDLCVSFYRQEQYRWNKKPGGLLPRSMLSSGGFIPGGNEQSINCDNISGMDKYVHLCFSTDHPMKYLVKKKIKRN